MPDTRELRTPRETSARAFLHGRYDEAFPVLTDAEISRLRPFGAERRHAAGEALVEAGKPSPGMVVILAGHVLVTARDGLGRVTPVVELGPGQFTAEITALSSGSQSLVDAHAQGPVDTLRVPPERVRAILIAQAQLGERLMRAFTLRRGALIEAGDAGPLLIGAASSGDVIRLERFLAQASQPYHLLDPGCPVNAKLVAPYVPPGSTLPVVVCPDGVRLENPSEEQLARALGLVCECTEERRHDVAIIGSGPAGLATAVYAASEGLSVVLIDARGVGGQAGASTRIENYLGFPSGICGLELTRRAYAQARKFGADVMILADARRVERAGDAGFVVVLGTGKRLGSRSVVVATGARYRRPGIESLAAFEGRGVWWWASPLEATLCKGQEVMVLGGGNSAGQAAVFLAEHAAKVTMMVRGPALAATMSRYLVDRIAASPAIEVRTRTTIVALDGTPESGLRRVRWRAQPDGEERISDVCNVFIFAGAEPATKWLAECGVACDRNGFVITGAGSSQLETSVPGVFAVGDVRAGSVKRVGSAIGEGAQVVAALHQFLAGETSRTRNAA
jgi:thioredoxin reductase (NADPH)